MNYTGLNIKKIREKWGLSQEEFGWLIHATRGMVMTYEVRGSRPRTDTMLNIAKVTGIRPTKLIDTELQESGIPDMRPEVEQLIIKGRRKPETMLDVPDYDESPMSGKNVEYMDRYISLLEQRLTELEQDKKFLQRMLELNFGKVSAMMEKVMKLQTAHDDVIMKSLDRLEKRPEGTLSAAADNLEMEIDQRLENLSDNDKKAVSNK